MDKRESKVRMMLNCIKLLLRHEKIIVSGIEGKMLLEEKESIEYIVGYSIEISKRKKDSDRTFFYEVIRI